MLEGHRTDETGTKSYISIITLKVNGLNIPIIKLLKQTEQK